MRGLTSVRSAKAEMTAFEAACRPFAGQHMHQVLDIRRSPGSEMILHQLDTQRTL
jgi:hypothetical protein